MRRWARWTAAAVGVAAVGLWLQTALLDKHAREVGEAAETMAAANARQREENARLAARIGDVRANPDAVFEELAREKLFMVKSGEVYVLPKSEAR